MLQGRGTATDSLSNIIQVLQLGRKTGILTVERGDGPTLETGEMTFVHGEVTQAFIDALDGQRALNRLLMWKFCHFTFTPLLNENHTGSIVLQPPPQQPATTQPLSHDRTYDPISNHEIQHIPGEHYGPRRIAPAQQALPYLEQVGLSRTHRHLFLLIDGQRTPTELTRLMGKPMDEVQHLLDDLEYIGVIEQ